MTTTDQAERSARLRREYEQAAARAAKSPYLIGVTAEAQAAQAYVAWAQSIGPSVMVPKRKYRR